MVIIINKANAAQILRDFYGFVANVDFLAGDNGDGKTGVDWLSQTPMPAVAEIEAITDPQIATAVTSRERAVLSALVNAAQREAALTRAAVLVILDEFNAHALKTNAILNAVDGAATLAALKTAVAAIADYPQRTKAQLLTAMQNKIQAGDTD
jgi:hypothetical protein